MVAAVKSIKKTRRAPRRRLLETHTPIAVKRIARELVSALQRARRRLNVKHDDDALHDFRVALRRARSTLRIYRPIVGRRLSERKLRRGLKCLTRMTAPARDAEVGLLWLRRGRSGMGPAERAACNRLIADWKARRDASYKEVRRTLRQDFDALDARLSRALRPRTGDRTAPLLAPTVARLMRAQISAIAAELQRITSVFDARAIHAARVEAKHLRYLLEPFAADVPNGAALVRSLKRFQYEFGELCDRQVLSIELIAVAGRYDSERLGRELRSVLEDGDQSKAPVDVVTIGLLDLARRLRAEREQRFAGIESRYLGAHQRAFLAPYQALADALANPPPVETPASGRS